VPKRPPKNAVRADEWAKRGAEPLPPAPEALAAKRARKDALTREASSVASSTNKAKEATQ
jgi:hypothetical protein